MLNLKFGLNSNVCLKIKIESPSPFSLSHFLSWPHFLSRPGPSPSPFFLLLLQAIYSFFSAPAQQPARPNQPNSTLLSPLVVGLALNPILSSPSWSVMPPGSGRSDPARWSLLPSARPRLLAAQAPPALLRSSAQSSRGRARSSGCGQHIGGPRRHRRPTSERSRAAAARRGGG